VELSGLMKETSSPSSHGTGVVSSKFMDNIFRRIDFVLHKTRINILFPIRSGAVYRDEEEDISQDDLKSIALI
jgi:hypothetical protein